MTSTSQHDRPQPPRHRRERFEIAPVSPEMRSYQLDAAKVADEFRDKYQLDTFEDATPKISAELYRAQQAVRIRHGMPIYGQ